MHIYVYACISFLAIDIDIAAEQPSISLRLANGTSVMEGRLEVQYNGEWGTVCEIDWDKRDAEVACRQLGFQYAARSTSSVEFGEGSGRIMISSLGCIGSESNLLECEHGGLGFTPCSHRNDVGLVCSSKHELCAYSTQIRKHPLTYTDTLTHRYTHADTNAHRHTQHTRTHRHTHHTHMYTHAQAHTHTHIHPYTRMHTHVHTETQTQCGILVFFS